MQKKSQEKIVLDAWAILALLQGEEPACSVVSKKLRDSSLVIYMSWINLGEVYYILYRKHGEEEAESTLEEILQLPVKFNEPDKKTIKNAAILKGKYRLSYADAFAIALAQKVNGILLTGDPEIISLKNIIKTLSLRRD